MTELSKIVALAAKARDNKKNGQAVTMGIAIRKAINGKGIFHKPDVKRLMKEVGAHIAQEDSAVRRTSRRSAHYAAP